MRIERLRREYDLMLRWVPFPLHPDWPAAGRPIAELFPGHEDMVADMSARLAAAAEAEGLPYGGAEFGTNTRLAQELGCWADEQPGGEALHDALFRAFFVDERNIGQPDTLLAVAESVGLDPEAAREVLDTRRFEAAVDADWARSRQLGISGVPFFVAGRHGAMGFQPYDQLARMVEQAGARRR